MNKTLLLIGIAFSGIVNAEGYLDIGAGLSDSSYAYKITQDCKWKGYEEVNCTAVPTMVHGIIGTVELGYTANTWTVYINHTSLINEKDGRGLNILGFKKRIKLFE